ncbi:MAG: hypothetical protein FWD57_04855, partial [Polyangiaceae bacterium]|nr:hypothetical protein [Polyangiaceae bacterium]
SCPSDSVPCCVLVVCGSAIPDSAIAVKGDIHDCVNNPFAPASLGTILRACDIPNCDIPACIGYSSSSR